MNNSDKIPPVSQIGDYKSAQDTFFSADLIPPWLKNFLYPLIVGTMVGCIALELVRLIHFFVPDWNGTYFVLAPVVAALIAQYSYGAIHRRFTPGMELLRFNLVELVVFFLVLKVVRYFWWSWPSVLVDIRGWERDPYSFFDIETLIAFFLAFFGWFAANQTAKDLELIGDPLLRMEKNNAPLRNLAWRFFLGGFLLLLFGGVARVGVAAMTNMSRPPVPGIVLNVLIYFLLGFVILGQARFNTLRKAWAYEKTKVADNIAVSWVRYSVLFMVLALAIAFILPSGYTVGILDVAVTVLWGLNQLITLILFILMLPIGLLFSVFGFETEEQPIAPPQFESPPPLTSPTGVAGTLPWLEILKSFAFWAIVIAGVLYVLRSYFRDRPGLVADLKRISVVAWLRETFHAFWDWLRGVPEAVKPYLPQVRLNFRRRRRDGQRGFLRRMGQSLRGQIVYYYMQTLDAAGEVGLGRRTSQTPYEYQDKLEPQLQEAQEAMAALTQAFVEARYSNHDLKMEDLAWVKKNWEEVTKALRLLEQGEEQ